MRRCRKWGGRRVLVAILALFVLLFRGAGVSLAADDGSFVNGWNPCNPAYENLDSALSDAEKALSDNGEGRGTIIAGIVSSIFDGLTHFFMLLGAKPQCNLVYGLETKLWPSPTFLYTFSATEEKVIKYLHPAFMALALGVFLVAAVAFSGFKIALGGADYRQRAVGMYTLQRLAVTSLLVILSPVLIGLAFELNHLLVGWFSSLTPIQDFMQAFRGTYNFIGTFLLRFFSTIVLIALNLTYMLRRFALLVLVVISPLCILAYAFDTTQAVTRLWVQEFLGNLLIQPVQAILFTTFFLAYGRGNEVFPAIAFLLVLQPLTNMLVAVITGGRQSHFTGMGAAAAMMGLAGAFQFANSMREMAIAARGANVAQRLARAGGAALKASAGGAEAAASAAASAAGGATAASAESLAAPPPSPSLQRMRLTTHRWRAAGKVAGAAVTGLVGAGIGMAGGHMGYGAQLGAEIGGHLGGIPGGATGYLVGSTIVAAQHGGSVSPKELWQDVKRSRSKIGALVNIPRRRQQALYDAVLENVPTDAFASDADKHVYVRKAVWGTMVGGAFGETATPVGEGLAHMSGWFERGGYAARLDWLGWTLSNQGLANKGDTIELRRNGQNMEVRVNGNIKRIESAWGFRPGRYEFVGGPLRPLRWRGPLPPSNPPPPPAPPPPNTPPASPPSIPPTPPPSTLPTPPVNTPPTPPPSTPPTPPPASPPPSNATPYIHDSGFNPFGPSGPGQPPPSRRRPPDNNSNP